MTSIFNSESTLAKMYGISIADYRDTIVYKISATIVGAFTIASSLCGVLLAILLLTYGMDPLKTLAQPYVTGWLMNCGAAIITNGRVAIVDPETLQDAYASVIILIDIFGYILIALGIADVIHFVLSCKFIYGAWKGKAALMGQWITFTRRITAAHAAIGTLVVLCLLAVKLHRLALMLFGVAFALSIIMLVLMSLVVRYHAMLVEQSKEQLAFQPMKTSSLE